MRRLERERERELAIILVIYHRAWRAAVAFDEKRILLTVFLPSFFSPRTQGPNRPPPPHPRVAYSDSWSIGLDSWLSPPMKMTMRHRHLHRLPRINYFFVTLCQISLLLFKSTNSSFEFYYSNRSTYGIT